MPQGKPGPCRVVDTDVVIVGNGPAAIALSFMLSGHSPHYTGVHPNPVLHARLCSGASDDRGASGAATTSLFEQDLLALSEGLEGRSASGIAVLLDQLHLPNADTDPVPPQATRLQWQHNEHGRLEHLVLGSGLPGGYWARMPADTLPVSPAAWLELPAYTMQDWIHEREPTRQLVGDERITAGLVATYYQDYIAHFHLEDKFLSNVEVTSMRRMSEMALKGTCGCAHANGFNVFRDRRSRVSVTSYDEQQHQPQQQCLSGNCSEYQWLVQTIVSSPPSSPQTMFVRCKRIVLANGAFDLPRQLNVSGELSNPRVHHTFRSAQAMALVSPNRMAAALVIGAGISAADTIHELMGKGYHVTHVFRHKSGSRPLSKLSSTEFPHYAALYKRMRAGRTVVEDSGVSYTPFPDAKVVSIDGGQDSDDDENNVEGGTCCRVQLSVAGPGSSTHPLTIDNVDAVFVLIGRRPGLDFLPARLTASLQASTTDCKNAVPTIPPVDKSTFSWIGEPGLYAIGSLTGDKFVRFVLGGAVAVASDLLRSATTLSGSVPSSSPTETHASYDYSISGWLRWGCRVWSSAATSSSSPCKFS